RHAGVLLLLGSSIALLAGCPEDSVTHVRTTRDEGASAPSTMSAPAPQAQMPSAEAPAAAEPAPTPGMKGEVPQPPKPTGGDALTWTLPAGWTQTLTSGIR